jgi:hypothetical protein
MIVWDYGRSYFSWYFQLLFEYMVLNILIWDFEFFRNFEKKNYRGRKGLELPEPWRSARTVCHDL